MSCKNQYEKEGLRSYGDNIPGYAQGAYFPGDEPGIYCKVSGEYCDNEDGNTPWECVCIEDTDIPCPFCNEDGDRLIFLQKDGQGHFYCKECGEIIKQ